MKRITGHLEEKNGKYYVTLGGNEVEYKDDLPYLQYFAAKKSISGFMSNEEIWGENLMQYRNFYFTVIKNVEKIRRGICLI